MLNRRSHRRTKVQRKVEITPLETGRRSRWLFSPNNGNGDGPHKPLAGKLIDISCGGMCGAFGRALSVGTTCDVRITEEDGTVQRTRGTVRNVHDERNLKMMGIAFTEPIFALGDPARTGAEVGFEGSEPLALVVDDEEGVRRTLARFLQKRGLRVVMACDADEALELLRHEQPALMMLDIKMPGYSGVQLLETMAAEGLRVPNIWAMSGYASDEEALACLSLGAAEFMNKPFDLEHLDLSLQMLTPML